MSPDEHAAMIATRARFIAQGEPWRVPKVGTQTSADGTGDVPSFLDLPDQPARPARPAAPAQPERLTLWDQPLDIWSTDR